MSDDIFAAVKADNDQNKSLPRIVDIYRELGVGNEQRAEQTSIRHVFFCVCAEPEWEIDEAPEDNAQAIKEQVTKKTAFRLHLYQKFAPDFFKGEEYNKDALVMAVICDDLLEKPFTVSSESDPLTLQEAYQIWLDARDHEEYGIENVRGIDKTSWFLACVNILEQCENIKNTAGHYTYNQLKTCMKDLSQVATSLIRPDTGAGKEIQKRLDEFPGILKANKPDTKIVHLSFEKPQPR